MLPILGDVPVKVVPELYHAMPMTILKVIDQHGRGADPLMLVGHNPGMETTVSNVVGNIVPFPTGAIAHVQLVPNQTSEVLAVWRPSELPAE
jgi:phosphohistidine phosphatase SixA